MPTMTDPALICPKCGESIALTESLAAPLVAATRTQYEQHLATQTKRFADEKKTVLAQQGANDRRTTELEDATKRQRQEVAQAVENQVAAKLATERKTIAEQESARARRQVDEELQAERSEAAQQKERNLILTRKLTIAQEAKAGLLKKQQVLEDKERELGLELQRGIAAGLADARAKALAEAQAGLDLKVQDRDNTITQLRDQITSLQRRPNRARSRLKVSRSKLFSNISSALSSLST